jgi:hypothetical protein
LRANGHKIGPRPGNNRNRANGSICGLVCGHPLANLLSLSVLPAIFLPAFCPLFSCPNQTHIQITCTQNRILWTRYINLSTARTCYFERISNNSLFR